MNAEEKAIDLIADGYAIITAGVNERRRLAKLLLDDLKACWQSEEQGKLEECNWCGRQSRRVPTPSQPEPQGEGEPDVECNCDGGWPIPHGVRDHANVPRSPQPEQEAEREPDPVLNSGYDRLDVQWDYMMSLKKRIEALEQSRAVPRLSRDTESMLRMIGGLWGDKGEGASAVDSRLAIAILEIVAILDLDPAPEGENS